MLSFTYHSEYPIKHKAVKIYIENPELITMVTFDDKKKLHDTL